MMNAIEKDFKERFHTEDGEGMHLHIAYTKDLEAALEFKKMVLEKYPNIGEIVVDPLSLSVSCHIGPEPWQLHAVRN